MGGKAFEGVTQRINKQDILGTLSWLERHWDDFKLNVAPSLWDAMLGSAGKNETSGDIDLNFEISRYDQTLVANQLIALLGQEFVKPRPGNNQIFTAVPIHGDAAKYGRVQIDFMFGRFKWQKFSYYSPALNTNGTYNWLQSAYKGLYRTELIKAITAFHSDWVLEEDGEMVARVGPTFFHDKGIVWRYRHRPMRKDGKGRVKALEELTEQEFMLIYPSAQKARAHELTDPDELMEMFFGKHHTADTAETFEKLWTHVTWNYDKDDRALIAKIYIERLNSLKADIPKSLAKTLGVTLPCDGTKS